VAVEDPYVGPRPFERADAGRFFGRKREARDLASLVVAHRVVLLYSASGAGKSSLVNAGVIPLLERKGLEVLPIVRVAHIVPGGAGNPFSAGIAAQLEGEGSAGSALRSRPLRLDFEGEPAPRALVFDQFEELFTAYAELWSERVGLFDDLHAALDNENGLRVLFVMREEFLAQLEPYGPRLPGALKTRFRLDRLNREGALAAVTLPLEGMGRSFEPTVAETLVDDLLRLRVERDDGSTVEVPGEFVEPVQLQVVCTRLWAELPPEVTTIDKVHVQAFADLDAVLARFYDDALTAAHLQSGVAEDRLREWVERDLITAGGTRSTVYRGRDETAGLPNPAVEALEESRLVRAENRAGAFWYELTHDRLIGPIKASNARVASRRRSRRVRRAVLLIAGVVGTLSAIAGIVAGFGLGRTEHRGPGAVISALQVQPSVTLREFQRRHPTAGLGGQPSQQGVMATFSLASNTSGSLLLTALLLRAATPPVIVGNSREVVRSPRRLRSLRSVWLALPVASPDAVGRRFYVEILVTGAARARAKSLVFATGDTTPPALVVPGRIVVPSFSAVGVVVSYRASAIDRRDGRVVPACEPSSGSRFPIGTTTVVCLATDSAGNISRAAFPVSVLKAPE
jgi:Novel STAND NTPase 1/HYR domain